jgi:hypothetical protein
MSVTEVLLTHLHAHDQQKGSYFFSRWKHDWLKANGKTHFCFDCIGCEGFTVDENGTIANRLAQSHMESGGNSITVAEALADTELKDHLGIYQGNHSDSANFVYTDELVSLSKTRDSEIRFWNPMEHHNKSHTAVIGNIQDYEYGSDWLEGEMPDDFPFVVCIL